MADNITLNAGSGGSVLATDDITSVHYQIIKLAHGALDAATLVSTSSGLPVQKQGTWDITNAGTFATQVDGAALTSLQLIDDIVHSGDAVLSKYAAIGAVYDDTTPVAVTENQAQSLRMSSRRELYIQLRDAAGNERGLNVDANGALAAVLGAGTAAIGKLAANSGVDIGDVDVLSIAAGTNLIGDVGIQGRTTGGLTLFKDIDVDETEDQISAVACTLYGFYAYNNTAAGTKRFVKLYNATAATVVVGTTVPDMTFELDGTQGMVFNVAQGIAFSTALTVAATTGVADNDVGAPGANDVLFQAWFR